MDNNFWLAFFRSHIGWEQLLVVLDLVLVYLIVYRFLLWMRRSRSAPLLRGLFGLFFIYFISIFLGLTTLRWILGKFATVVVLVLIILFQPELRRFLERLGSSRSVFSPFVSSQGKETVMIGHLLKAVQMLAKERVGALIVIEAGVNLGEYIGSGIPVWGQMGADLLVSLFWPNAPTHDGAVIIREDQIAAAGCLLPLTETELGDRRLGMRHRAAVGLSEIADALVIIVSEETGVISMAEQGQLTRYMTKEALEARLFNLYQESNQKPHWFKSFFQKKEF